MRRAKPKASREDAKGAKAREEKLKGKGKQKAYAKARIAAKESLRKSKRRWLDVRARVVDAFFK